MFVGEGLELVDALKWKEQSAGRRGRAKSGERQHVAFGLRTSIYGINSLLMGNSIASIGWVDYAQ